MTWALHQGIDSMHAHIIQIRKHRPSPTESLKTKASTVWIYLRWYHLVLRPSFQRKGVWYYKTFYPVQISSTQRIWENPARTLTAYSAQPWAIAINWAQIIKSLDLWRTKAHLSQLLETQARLPTTQKPKLSKKSSTAASWTRSNTCTLTTRRPTKASLKAK